MTRQKLIYNIRERLDLYSDTNEWTDEYLAYLIDQKRGDLIRERINGRRRFNHDSAQQLIKVPLILGNKVENIPYEKEIKSDIVIPKLISKTEYVSAYSPELANYNINLKTPEQFKYSGYNKRLPNQIYVTIDHDDILKLRSDDGSHRALKYILLKGIFDSPEEAYDYQLDRDPKVEFDYARYPLENRLQSLLSQVLISQDLANFMNLNTVRDDSKPTQEPIAQD